MNEIKNLLEFTTPFLIACLNYPKDFPVHIGNFEDKNGHFVGPILYDFKDINAIVNN